MCLVISQAPKVALNLQQEERALAGAPDPSDEVVKSIDPNATEQPDEPLEDDNQTGTPTPTTTPFPTVTIQATFSPFPTITSEVFETESPAPTFAVDIPGETTPTLTPTPKPAIGGSSNIGLIIGAVIGTILLIIGIVWIILSRQKQSNDYTMPAPPANPTYPPYQPDNMNNAPTSTSSEWTQPGEQAPYTTPYDQYVGTTDPNQPK